MYGEVILKRGNRIRRNVTFSPIRAGSMPKKGLIAMAGRISAPSSAGRGAMHTPPVSEWMKGDEDIERREERVGAKKERYNVTGFVYVQQHFAILHHTLENHYP